MRPLEVAGIDMVHADVDLSGRCLMQAYAPELNKRCRPYLKPTNKSYRIDETYIKVAKINICTARWIRPDRRSTLY